MLAVLCWCGRQIVEATQKEIINKQTRSCGREGCEAPEGPTVTNENSARVLNWRANNRERYNAYMRELRRKNPKISDRADLNAAKRRAKKAGREFDEEAWLAGRRRRQEIAQRHRR